MSTHESNDQADGASATETPTKNKKRKTRGGQTSHETGFDIDQETPRAPAARSARSYNETPSLPPSESLEATSASGRSSPTKALARFEIADSSIVTDVLKPGAKGAPLACSPYYGISTGSQWLEASYRRTSRHRLALLIPLRDSDPAFEQLDDFMFETSKASGTQNMPGGLREHRYRPETMLDNVFSVVDMSTDCQKNFEGEYGWNNLVHTPMIAAALYGGPPRRGELVCVVPWLTQHTNSMHARIIKHYLPSVGYGKMVDYTLSIDPEHDADPRVLPAIETFRKKSVFGGVNHTDCDNLRHRPLAYRDQEGGENEAKAQVQMGVWHAAQWNFLASHVGGRISTLEYIPGLHVIGRTWTLVATTYVLWQGPPIGVTDNPLGVLQIVAALQRLKTWAEDEYWPWYKKELLGLGNVAETPDMTSEGAVM
ncbi:LOW QUALITY PROTEIN: methyltransferase type 11 [Colletotrichum tofieldiae]|nr:LOW QUALITY PROTEIN: methyltransferase type 11 [Colletotrichum tofieldiae]